MRLYAMVGALVISTLITLVPSMVITVFIISDNFSPSATTILVVLLGSQTVIHPIIETLFIPDVRRPLVKLVTCRTRRPSSTNEENGKVFTHCFKIFQNPAVFNK